MTARTLPATLPSVYEVLSGASITPDVNTGGYDFMVGGFGFRLATDTEFPYTRSTEPVTDHRYDSSLEPGEQSLAPVPWIKSQSSFHAGAGQLNLEQGFTAFQYQQEQVEHIRFDTCQGVDVWTPGVVKRLPATTVTALATTPTCVTTATVGSTDYAVLGGVHSFVQVAFTAGPDSAPTITDIDLTGVTFGGASNCTVTSIVTDGSDYYALIQLGHDGSAAGVRTYVVKGSLSSTAAPTPIYKGGATSAQFLGALGWQKARLVAGLGRSFYALETSPTSPPVDITTLTPSWTSPSGNWTFIAFAESPTAILGAGSTGRKSSIMAFELDTSGAVPTLSGGTVADTLPNGELISSMRDMTGSFLAVGTNSGIRVGTFDTFTGKLNLGPASVVTTQPVLAIAGRDRFFYGSFTNQQADGSTGLVRLDVSMVVDTGGRLAWAPDLQPPSTAATRHGAVQCVAVLPQSNRLIFTATDGLHVEQSAPNALDPAWLRTSRIRYGTTEMKLFQWGRITGSLDSATITVNAVLPFSGSKTVGTFGFLANGNPGEFAIDSQLYEWAQMQFTLNGVSCELGSYQVKAYPAPSAQDVIICTALCFSEESDRDGNDVSDPLQPRERWEAVKNLKNAAKSVRFVEFTNTGSMADNVLIDQLEFRATVRPTSEDDFGGYITFKLRILEAE